MNTFDGEWSMERGSRERESATLDHGREVDANSYAKSGEQVTVAVNLFRRREFSNL